MKKITVTLSDKAEAYFDEIMYSLPKYADGSGMCTQSQAINYTLVSLQAAEKKWENEKEPQQPSGETPVMQPLKYNTNNLIIRSASQQPSEDIEEIKLKWQQHNRDNGLSWNEVAELVNQVALTRPTVSEEEIEKVLEDYIAVQFVFLNPKVWADEIRGAKAHFMNGYKAAIKELNR